jgi:hypothetical protein
MKKKGFFIRGVASLEWDKLVAFHYLNVFDIWADRRVAFGGMGLIRGGTTVMCNCNLSNFR